MRQTGGTNTTNVLTIGSGGQYQLNGGTLQVNGGLVNQGVFDGGNKPGSLGATGILDLTSGTWKNLGDTSVNIGANSLLIVPAGFNPATGFGHFTSVGLTHTAGTTLNLLAGQGFGGTGIDQRPGQLPGHHQRHAHQPQQRAGDFRQRIGLPGQRRLTVNDAVSGMTGGSLSASNQFVGRNGTGTFTQSGGTNGANLYLGYNAGDSGSYVLSGTSQLLSFNQYVGYSGTGNLTQSGGNQFVVQPVCRIFGNGDLDAIRRRLIRPMPSTLATIRPPSEPTP